jgi:SOS-response transcriptional repressor LexA
MDDLTKKQQRILSFISNTLKTTHKAPTYKEMEEYMGVSSVRAYLSALEIKGRIIRNKGWRGIELGASEKLSNTTINFREHARKSTNIHYHKDTKKGKARAAIGSALRSGKMSKPSVCSKCEGVGIIQAHHPNYSQPLVVEWLCRDCHALHHHVMRETSL